jgi:DNA-binding response OmpR family regulator
MITTALQNAGFEVFVSTCGDRAAELFTLHKERLQVLITDLVMPRLFGDQLALKLVTQKLDLK